jgi:NitT/TauT family transport system ATP-binding protein
MALLRLDNVSLKYTEGGQLALKDVSLEVEEGEFIAIVGPSGCGKSSTIGLLAGLLQPHTGEIFLDNKPIKGPGLDRAVVFQDYSLFPWMTVLENISFALKQVKRPSKKEALHLLDLVGVSDSALKYPSELSGGMRQRVAIARAFALGSPVYLMDEPFGAVDAKNRIHLQDLLLRLWRENGKKKTVVIVTHDIDEALYLADKVVVFTPGPGRIRQIMDVPFERPRKRNFLVHDKKYIAMRNDIFSLLQDELIDELANVEGGEGI